MTELPDGVHFAPEEMPHMDEVEGENPLDQRWLAALGRNGQHAVCLENSVEPNGSALLVAVCPSRELAQYLAYMHNMLLKGNELFEASGGVDAILKAYATGASLARRPEQPEPTGGYL